MSNNQYHIGIIVSKFNQSITDNLLSGAKHALQEENIKDYDVIEVPGALEIPLAAKRIAQTKKYDAIVVLGCVIKGQTDHYEHVARESIHHTMQVSLDHNIPIGIGILTTSNVKHARARASDESEDNKGYEAMKVALEMISK